LKEIFVKTVMLWALLFFINYNKIGRINMSQICIDFLRQSFLSNSKLIDSNYSSVSEKDLIKELHRYREHILSNLQKNILEDNSELNVCIESFNDLPKEELLKQLALYIDRIVIPDPLFELTEEKTNIHTEFNALMGFSGDNSVDRRSLALAVSYIIDIYTPITFGLVKLMPISLIHELPKDLPIKYSATGFRDVLPEQINDYYNSISRVCNVNRNNGAMTYCLDEPLSLGTTIHVSFPEEDRLNSVVYQYMETKVIDFDDSTRKLRMGYRPADQITPEAFDAWVNQSINQAAIKHFTDKYKELLFAKKAGCMYLTQSQLTANILQMAIQKPTIESEIATMALKLDVPVFEKISLDDILSIRYNGGEAFHNFRAELNSKLISIRDIADAQELQKRLDNITYELNEIQVKEVEKEYRKIKRSLKIDSALLTGSLLSSFFTGGLTLVGAAGAIAKGGFDSSKYYNDVIEHNGFFLWKLNNLAQKYTA
jgi:hypothetical protein